MGVSQRVDVYGYPIEYVIPKMIGPGLFMDIGLANGIMTIISAILYAALCFSSESARRRTAGHPRRLLLTASGES